MAEQSRRALVTGASRGIGKAIAIYLARAGYDVAISARTVRPGESRENSASVHRSDTQVLPGSLEETAAEIEAVGRGALIVPMDLIDRASVEAAAATIMQTWGGLDCLVHNGRYIGPGLMDTFLDTPVDAYGKFFEAHCVSPIVLTKIFLPGMLERGFGQVVNITSAVVWDAPKAAGGKGASGLGYHVGKSAGNPLVGVLNVEFKDQGIRAFNVDPGFIGTERNTAVLRSYGRKMLAEPAPPSVIGAAVAWLVSAPEGEAYAGQLVDGQLLAEERKLHPPFNRRLYPA